MHSSESNFAIKSGQETLTHNSQSLDFSILDFWRWSVSDILSNATRGRFAEFIVATAIGVDLKSVRDEWSAYDLITPEGIKIEVKSSAFVQSWNQKAQSKILYSIRSAKFWDSKTGIYSTEKSRHADVYVFCLLHHEVKETIDPLNMNQWEFYVVSTPKLKESSKTIGLKSLKRLAEAIAFDQLEDTIKETYRFGLL